MLTIRTRSSFTVAFALVLLAYPFVVHADQASSPESGHIRRILDAAGTHGGLIVHLGCGDGDLATHAVVPPGLIKMNKHS